MISKCGGSADWLADDSGPLTDSGIARSMKDRGACVLSQPDTTLRRIGGS